MIEWVVLGTGVVVAAAYCAWPLRRGANPRSAEASARIEAEGRRDAALAGLDDLEFDREAGKLGVEDFDRLRTLYESEAVAALNELDRLALDPGAPSSDDPLEAEIAAARRLMRCPRCGAPRRAVERCPRCGN
ncbi:MAG TPA: hypothetical protein VHJ82_01615 [Actinomycetota bacterium]|nr:hypothetical protein [Actinomycetota bacterium]